MMAVAKQEDPVFLPQSLQTDKYSTLIYIYQNFKAESK